MANRTATTSTPSARARITSASPIGPGGLVYCFCGDEAKRSISQTERNPNKPFYSCPKPSNDSNRCKFWKWENELPTLANSQSENTMNSATPNKRNRAEEATPSTSSGSPTKPGGYLNTGSPSEPIVGDSDIEDILLGDEPQFKKHKKDEIELCEAQLDTPTKGKAPMFAIKKATPSQNGNQWKAIRDDPENPFHDRAAALRHATTVPVSPSTPGFGSPSKIENIGEDLTRCADDLIRMAEKVKKLERQRVAAEKSKESRDKMIVKLKTEVEELKRVNRALEEELQAAKSQK